MTKKKTFWVDTVEDEAVCHNDRHGAIRDILENIPADDNGDIPPLSPGSHTVEIIEVAPVTVTEDDIIDCLVDALYDKLDSDRYQHDDCDEFELSDLGTDVREKMEELAKLIAEKFEPSLLEPTGNRITVDAYAWCLEHEPEWLK